MNVVLITGMLAAGKSIALRAFEDMDYYVIDNMPPSLIRSFLNLQRDTGVSQNAAFVIDMRAESYFSELYEAIDYLKNSEEFLFTMLYVDANDEALISRYKLNRRRHILMEGDENVQETIRRERAMLSPLKDMADYYIDTSETTDAQFRRKVLHIYEGARGDSRRFIVNIISFGFKYTLPKDADIVFDVRFAPNPFHEEDLRHFSGLDERVAAYVTQREETEKFLSMAFDMITYLLPYYEKDGKSQLIIGVGCTGGRHRSVAIAAKLSEMLSGDEVYVVLSHRDIEKEN
ncbi:MAG: RNase adapter RapZ [Eubacteriaceae bacterium]|nr:RNase adapter RapZ [Eubacteriaceae bacterium]